MRCMAISDSGKILPWLAAVAALGMSALIRAIMHFHVTSVRRNRKTVKETRQLVDQPSLPCTQILMKLLLLLWTG